MKKTSIVKRFSCICLVFMFAIMICMAVPAQEVAAKPIKFRAVTFLPKHLAAVAGMKMMADRVKERSNGQLVIEYLGGPEVIPPPAQAEALMKGRIDIGVNAAERFGDLVPEINVLHLSELNPQEERQKGTYKWIDEHLKKKLNTHYLGRATSNTGFFVYTSFPVSKVDDLKGKQMASRPLCFSLFRALGANPVAVGKGDWFSAVERGVVDGHSIPLDSVVSWGLVDVTKYTIDHALYTMSSPVFMVNLDKWNKLPGDLQKLLTDVAIELEPELAALRGKRNAAARKKMISAGVKFIKFSPADEKKFLSAAYDSNWAVYKKKVGADVYAEARKLFLK